MIFTDKFGDVALTMLESALTPLLNPKLTRKIPTLTYPEGAPA